MKTIFIYCEQDKDGILCSSFNDFTTLIDYIKEQFMLSEQEIIDLEKNNKLYLDGMTLTITEIPFYDTPTEEVKVRQLNTY